MFHYFAYGSVLSPSHAREWCASHALDVAPFLEGVPAKLSGYRLVFDVPSRFWQGLVADIVEAPGSIVEGAVFTIDDAARIAVMRKEGVATGLYREIEKDVVLADGRTIRASAFEAVPERRAAEGPASSRYLDSLIEGAAARGLSESWKAALAAVPRDAGRPPPPGISLGTKR